MVTRLVVVSALSVLFTGGFASKQADQLDSAGESSASTTHYAYLTGPTSVTSPGNQVYGIHASGFPWPNTWYVVFEYSPGDDSDTRLGSDSDFTIYDSRYVGYGTADFTVVGKIYNSLEQLVYTTEPLSVDVALSLVVNIYGPTSPGENIECTWQSEVSGGDSNYTYSWKINFDEVGTSEDYQGNTGTGSFPLSLTVTDGSGNSGNTGITVWTGGSGGCWY
jgi:hypothetical protein